MKTGNTNSSLLSKLIEAAELTQSSNHKDAFAEGIFNAAKTKTASVEEIICAALQKTAQSDLPQDAPLPEGPPLSEVPPGALADPTEEAKKKIAEALVSLCGGDIEACCSFIKSCCGVDPISQTEQQQPPL